MEMTKLIANNASRSVDQISDNNNIFDKDEKRGTEKTIIREQLLERWLHQKQLEEEVIKDMVLQWGKNSMPADNKATNESSNKPRNGRILSKDQRRELEKRVIGEEILSSWLRRKQLEEEVMTELFGEEMLQRGKDSVASDYQEVTSDTCNKPLTDLRKIIHIQDKGKGSGLVPYVHNPISLNGQERNDQSPGNDTNGGLIGSLPIQRPPRARNTTNPGIIGLGKGATTPSKGERSALVPYVQVPTFLNGHDWNDQSPGNHTDGGLTGSLPFQRLPRAPNNTNPEKLIDLGKGAMTPLVNSVKECTPIGGDNETAGKTITKRKHWECDLCNVVTSTESVLKEHLRGKRHLAKQKASSETATPLTSNKENYVKSIRDDSLLK